MKIVLVFICCILLASYTQSQNIRITNWVNITQIIAHPSESNLHRFNILLPHSYDGGYYLEMTIEFKDAVSFYYVYFGESFDLHTPDIAQVSGPYNQDTIILSTFTGPSRYWDSDGLACGRFQGYIRSDIPVKTVTVKLYAPDTSIDFSPVCGPYSPIAPPKFFDLRLIVIASVIIGLAACCCRFKAKQKYTAITDEKEPKQTYDEFVGQSINLSQDIPPSYVTQPTIDLTKKVYNPVEYPYYIPTTV